MRPLARLNHYYWKYRHLFIPGLLCAMASAAFAIIVPIVVRQAVDGIPRMVTLYNVYGGSPVQGYLYAVFFAILLLFGVLIVLLSLCSGVFSFLMRQTIVVASRHIEYDLRNKLYAHLQALSFGFYLRHPTGDLITRATSDIEQVRRYIGPAIMYVTRAVVVVVMAMTTMFIISPRLTLFALIPMPFLALSVFLVARMVHSRSDALQQQYSVLTSRVQEALSGIRVLKAYTREEDEARAFEEESARYRARTLDLARVEAAWEPVFLILVGLSTIIVVWTGGRLVVDGAITLGNIAEYIIYVALMTWPVASVGFVTTMVQRASASMSRLNRIFDTLPEVADDERMDPRITSIEGALAFRNVSFRYTPDGPWVLRNVDFEVPAGATLAVVGRTGSGKSTLVELIPRLLDPTEGYVEIDGHDVRTIPLEVLRRHIGYVPQEVFLFSDTVAGNIAFGNMDAPAEAIEEAAREAELLENVRDFPKGFETFVGERGITLSGGQKQRTSIARALVRDPRLLILDDALSAVDVNTERNILGHLRRHYGRRTIVIVSHRISAVQDADLILVLEDGRVVERGTHAELLERDGFYAGLYRKQLLEQEIAALS
ncbi:MAG: ABC transporter ATP-binding protein [Rhodothermaceae bacterium]|nr:MAG: ABC transporter ATP-binding protein [Rhodothermaceae bacterium]